MIYQEVEYTPTRKKPCIVLADGEYKGIYFFVVNIGTHPTAYMRVPTDHFLYLKEYYRFGEEYTNSPEPITFTDNSAVFEGHLNIPVKEGWYIGWDFAHIGDYRSNLYGPDTLGKKWTTQELICTCESMIDWLLTCTKKEAAIRAWIDSKNTGEET